MKFQTTGVMGIAGAVSCLCCALGCTRSAPPGTGEATGGVVTLGGTSAGGATTQPFVPTTGGHPSEGGAGGVGGESSTGPIVPVGGTLIVTVSETVRVRAGDPGAALLVSVKRPSGIRTALRVTASADDVAGVREAAGEIPVDEDSILLPIESASSATRGGPFPFMVRVDPLDPDSGLEAVESEQSLFVVGAPGSLDDSFGVSGRTYEPVVSAGSLALVGAGLDSDGGVVMFGNKTEGAVSGAWVQRYDARGGQDEAFSPPPFAHGTELLGGAVGKQALLLGSWPEGYAARLLGLTGAPASGFAMGGDLDLASVVPHFGLPRQEGGLWLGLGDSSGATEVLAYSGSGGAGSALELPVGCAPTAAANDDTGRLLVTVSCSDGPETRVGRFTAQGELDVSFGEATTSDGERSGFSALSFDDGWESSPSAVWPARGGAVLVLLRRQIEGLVQHSLVRLTVTGQVDTSYGSLGQLVVGNFITDSVAPLPDGEVAALVRDSFDGPPLLRKFLRSGVKDESFGTGGEVDLGTVFPENGVTSVPKAVLYECVAERLWLVGTRTDDDSAESGIELARLWL